jgi:hypothetical protein
MSNSGTIIDYYRVTKDLQILLRNVQQFEGCSARFFAGANPTMSSSHVSSQASR